MPGTRLLPIFRVAPAFALVLGTLPFAASAKSDLDMARSLAPVLARRELHVAGPGLLILQLRIDDRSKFRKEPLESFTIELTPALGGKPEHFEANANEPLLARLPAGRYCLSAIMRSTKRFEAKCLPPYVDATAGSVDASGMLDVRIGRKLEVTARDVATFHRDLGLTTSQREMVGSYLREQTSGGTRTFFISSPSGLVGVTRLYPDGVAETESYTLANAGYRRGAWRPLGPGFELSFNAGNTIDRMVPDGNTWFGTSADRTKYKPMTVATRQDRQYAVATDVACWHWSSCGNRFRHDVLFTPDYSFTGKVEALEGSIELEHSLVRSDDVARPKGIKVLGSTFPGAVTEAIVEQYGDTQFHPRLAGEKRRVSLRFSIREGMLSVEGSGFPEEPVHFEVSER